MARITRISKSNHPLAKLIYSKGYNIHSFCESIGWEDECIHGYLRGSVKRPQRRTIEKIADGLKVPYYVVEVCFDGIQVV